jgi:hypothetical protein
MPNAAETAADRLQTDCSLSTISFTSGTFLVTFCLQRMQFMRVQEATPYRRHPVGPTAPPAGLWTLAQQLDHAHPSWTSDT